MPRDHAWGGGQQLIGFVVSLMATLAGITIAGGWLSVALFQVFGLAFTFFLIVTK